MSSGEMLFTCSRAFAMRASNDSVMAHRDGVSYLNRWMMNHQRSRPSIPSPAIICFICFESFRFPEIPFIIFLDRFH